MKAFQGSLTTLSVAALMSLSLPVQALTLAEYLEQVKGQSTGYQGTSTQAEGARLKSREADLVFAPALFAEGRTGYDEKLSSSPALAYDRIESSNYKLGFTQQFEYGLQAKLYYEANKTDFVGANFGANVSTKFWDASPKIELNLPLLGGGFGSTSRANQDLVRQQNFADQFTNAHQAANFLVGAEAAYWRLSSWNEVLRIQEQGLKAAKNIFDYVGKKQRMNLGENSDVIQARALVEARTLELQMARNEARDSLRNFNKFRNAEPDAPADTLTPVDLNAVESSTVPTNRPGDRFDVKATEAQLASARAASKIATERNRATLDVYGTYALNGRDPKLDEAIADSGTSQRDTAFVGFKMNMPLNLSAQSDARAGALKTEKAAELNRAFSVYSQDMDWTTLTRNLADGKENFRLLTRIEEVQKTKLENERKRLRQGRTTTYQVLLFEQDYTQAAVTRVKSAANILSLQSQVKLYQSEKSLESEK